jgi:hypothetical protein
MDSPTQSRGLTTRRFEVNKSRFRRIELPAFPGVADKEKHMAKKKKLVVSLDGAQMTQEGLSYKGFILQPVVEKCDGCDRSVPFESENYCPSYANPARKWALGVCNFATHVKAELDKTGKVKINPLKASKRAAKGR